MALVWWLADFIAGVVTCGLALAWFGYKVLRAVTDRERPSQRGG